MRRSLGLHLVLTPIFIIVACANTTNSQPVESKLSQSVAESAVAVKTEIVKTRETLQEETARYVQERAQEFDACVRRLQARAVEEKLPTWVTEDVVGQLSFVPRVIELDRSQPEFTRSFEEYFSARVSEKRIKTGRAMLAKHRDFLLSLTQKYGVPGQYLMAFWGLETNYGGYLGKNSTLDSLATLGCDPRRSTYFTDELFNALRLITEAPVDPEKMRGSWAGAVGHTQFMPSNYRRYAQDGDGDGKIDLWNSEQDALASAAYFLQRLGWSAGQRWGREVRLPADFDYQQIGLKNMLPLHAWRKFGVADTSGKLLPELETMAAVIIPSGHQGPAFVVYSNFQVIMRWNRSQSYALSVGHLADRIAGAGGLHISPPKNTPRLDRTLVREIQTRLFEMGFDPNGIDGVFGSGTKAAVRAFQGANNLIPDGFLDQHTLNAIVGTQ